MRKTSKIYIIKKRRKKKVPIGHLQTHPAGQQETNLFFRVASCCLKVGVGRP